MQLMFIGDVMLGRAVNETLCQHSPVYPWGDTLEVLLESDWSIANLECVISDKGKPQDVSEQAFHFRSDPKNSTVLLEAGIQVVSLANNHALDFGKEALVDMVGLLQKKHIATVGAGASKKDAVTPVFSHVKKGAKEFVIASIAFTSSNSAFEATDTAPGVFYVPLQLRDSRAQELFNTISKAKQKADIVVVSAHWGQSWGYEVPKEHIPFAHALVDAGADIVMGHSAHIFRGIELYKGKPIFYCVGDFINDYAVMDEIERNDESFIFSVLVQDSRIEKLVLYPTVIADLQAIRAQSFRAKEIAARMKELCKDFNTKAVWSYEKEILEIVVT